MNDLTVIEHLGQRVLTTAQLAESYETEQQAITNNFNRNMSRYIAGKHYYRLEGDELKEFKAITQIDLLPNVNRLYLWTEKGAWLHAKSLNTDKAWEAYDKLVDEYYRVKSLVPAMDKLSPQLQLLISMELRQNQLEERIEKQEQVITAVKETFLQRDEPWRESINKMLNRLARDKNEYQSLRADTYQQLERRAGCDLNARLRNLRERAAKHGMGKTKIDALNRLDVIENDKKLKEIYTTIVREMALARV